MLPSHCVLNGAEKLASKQFQLRNIVMGVLPRRCIDPITISIKSKNLTHSFVPREIKDLTNMEKKKKKTLQICSDKSQGGGEEPRRVGGVRTAHPPLLQRAPFRSNASLGYWLLRAAGTVGLRLGRPKSNYLRDFLQAYNGCQSSLQN